MPMEKHIDLVGWLHVASGALFVLFAVFAASILSLVGAISGEPEAFAILSMIGGFVAVVMGLLSVPSLVAGWGLLKRKPWSRTMTLILSFLNLMNFPVGTALGGYSMWVLLDDESRRLLEGRRAYDQLPR